MLKSCLVEEGIDCAVRHLNLLLLKYLKVSTYEALGELYGFNDFLFSGLIEERPVAPDQLDAMHRFIQRTYDRVDLRFRAFMDVSNYEAFALRMRDEIVPAYLDDCLSHVLEAEPTLVGMTCMYDQTMPSVALGKRIKQARPDMLVALGGYALEPPVGPEIMAAFPWIDAVVVGEGEDKIASLARASVDRNLLDGIPGLVYRRPDGSVARSVSPATRVFMDASPTPDFDDWFDDVATMKAEHQIEISTPILPVESSRGCWWGQANHCVFCGIDDETMRYRVKAPGRVKTDLHALAARYGVRNFRFSDYILPYEYYTTLLPDLAADEERFGLHYEMKSNIKVEHADILAAAGAYAIQPGIESFSTPVLKKMTKGVTGIQNVLTIKLLQERGITCLYNVLYGFPTDEEEDYQSLVRLIPLLYHLAPPYNLVPVLTTRYAPMQVDPGRFGIQAELEADLNYRMIFSREFLDRSGFDLSAYCYIFQQAWEHGERLRELYDILVYQVTNWVTLQSADGATRLSWDVSQGRLCVFDSRYDPAGRVLSFGSDHARVYEAIAESILTTRMIFTKLGGDLPEERIEQVLDHLAEERLVLREGSTALGLALSLGAYDRLDSLLRARATAEVREEAEVSA